MKTAALIVKPTLKRRIPQKQVGMVHEELLAKQGQGPQG